MYIFFLFLSCIIIIISFYYKKYSNYLATQKLCSLSAKGEQRVIQARIHNKSLRIAAESVLEHVTEDENIEKEKKRRTLNQDDALSKELERRNMEEEIRKREIQRICEEDASLRELQEKLKTAYKNKERTAQIKEKESIKVIEKEKERAYDEMGEYFRRVALLDEVEKRKLQKGESLKVREVLAHQIEEKEKAIEEEAYSQWLKDKDQIDQIVSKIQHEDQLQLELKEKRKNETKLYITQFQKERNAFLAKSKYDGEQEAARIAAYAKEKADREAAVIARKAADLAFQEGLYAKLKEGAEAKMKAVKELEEFREILQTEENEERLRRDAESRRKKHEKSVQEMMQANELQKKLKIQLQEDADRHEAMLVEKMRAKFEADEEVEKHKSKQRADAKVSYKHGIEAQKKQLREMYEAEVRAEAAAVALQNQRALFREKVVEEARRRLLEEHAHLLGEHLPKGALQTSDDLKYLSSDGSNNGSSTFLTNSK